MVSSNSGVDFISLAKASGVDPEAIMKNGILKLTWNLPDKPIPKIKKIEIKSD